MVPSGDMSIYPRQKPSSVTGLLLFGDLASVESGLCGSKGMWLACRHRRGPLGGAHPPAAHASRDTSVRRKCRLLLPATAGRAGRLPSSPVIHGCLQLPPPLGASAAPSVQWERRLYPTVYRHKDNTVGILFKTTLRLWESHPN